MRIRPVLAITCCVLGAGSLLQEASHSHSGDRPLLLGMAAIVGIAGALLALRPLWAALAGRGLVWTVLAMATLINSASWARSSNHPSWVFSVGALALCAALLVAGRTHDRPAAAFQPNHHRGLLTLALVLGFADVATLIAWAVLALSGGGSKPMMIGAVFIGFAVAITASLVGLYRLRAWGFLLNLATNLAVVGAMVFDVLGLDLFRVVFIVPAVVQILLALPVLLAILLRRPLTAPPLIARLGALVPTLAVLVMAGLNVQHWYGEPVLHALARWSMKYL